jgi:protein-S-isoprenylcysteine O-methyltransferase Ste14
MEIEKSVVIVFALIVVFSGFYINLNNTSAAVKKEPTLFWFRILSPMALAISLMLYFFNYGSFTASTFTNLFGGLLFISGMFIRWVAVHTLGSSFTVQVAVKTDQKLKTDGVYRFIRHPSYTGLLMYNIGLGFLQHNWISIMILFLLPFIAVINRIVFEEKVLLNHFNSDYANYSRVTKKLIPGIF